MPKRKLSQAERKEIEQDERDAVRTSRNNPERRTEIVHIGSAISPLPTKGNPETPTYPSSQDEHLGGRNGSKKKKRRNKKKSLKKSEIRSKKPKKKKGTRRRKV